MRLSLLLVCLFIIGSCNFQREYPDEIEGYAPIYMMESEQFTIETLGTQPYKNPGKIYKYGSYTFQMDKGTGIHVINSSNPAQAQKVKFIKIPGVTDLSIKDNILYTNNFRDLVSLNISDISNVIVTHRNKNVFPVSFEGAPPEAGMYFECIDHSQGVVIGWEKKLLKNPKCFRQ